MERESSPMIRLRDRKGISCLGLVANLAWDETLPHLGEISPALSRQEAAQAPPGPPLLWRGIPANVKDSSGEPDGRKVQVRFYEGRAGQPALLLTRYKFVSKMLRGKQKVLEVGCRDAFATRIVLQEVWEVDGCGRPHRI